MRSKSFETQKVKDTCLKETRESRSLPIFWMGMIEGVLPMEGKECKEPRKIENVKKKSMSERGKWSSPFLTNKTYIILFVLCTRSAVRIFC